MYIRTFDNHPARVPQRVMRPAMVQRVAAIARSKGWDKAELLHRFFTLGYGRKSLQLVCNAMRGEG